MKKSKLQQLDPSTPTERIIFEGMITDVTAFWNVYEISSDFSMSMLGTDIMYASSGLQGTRPHMQYLPGTVVLCYKPENSATCYILGVLPRLTESATTNFPEWIQPFSAIGLQDDQPHKSNMDLVGVKYNFNEGRPYDAMPGDYGLSNPLGMMFNMGLSSITLRAGMTAGLWMFQLNQEVRLAAHNYRLWTALTEHTEGQDEGENYAVTRSSPYPWEMMGVKKYGDSVSADVPLAAVTEDKDPEWRAGNTAAPFDTVAPDQDMLPRISTFGGVLGDLSREVISAPPADFTGVETQSNKTNNIGLSETVKHMDGSVVISSTKSLTFQKDVFIPVPKVLRAADDSTGNTNINNDSEYLFAGLFGVGKTTLEEFTRNPSVSAASQLRDRTAWSRHKLGLSNLHTKSKDFHVSKEADTEGYNDESVDQSIFKAENKRFNLELPKVVNHQIDHREGNTRKFYKARSLVNLNDDGSITIEDGWGSQILMEKGNIILSCQGDVIVANGRNFSVMAPNDINLRAGHCLDASAGNGDVRIKAEKNLHMLGGNSGTGGVLVESRGEGNKQDFDGKHGTDVQSSGIILKATQGTVAAFGNSIYLRTLNNGLICVDADKGNGDIQVLCRTKIDFIASSYSQLYGTTANGEEPNAIVYVDGSQASFSQSGRFSVGATLVCAENGIFKSALIANSVSSASGGPTSSTSALTKNQNSKTFSDIATLNNKVKKNSDVPSAIGGFYSEGGMGTDSVVRSVGFSFRVDDKTNNQYNIEYVNAEGEQPMFSSFRWQQLYAINGAGSPWVEKAVVAPDGKKTLPYPGFNNWTQNKLFAKVGIKYWNPTTGELDDITQYTDSKGGTVETVTLEEGYKINLQM